MKQKIHSRKISETNAFGKAVGISTYFQGPLMIMTRVRYPTQEARVSHH
jgi:hypothetical protein